MRIFLDTSAYAKRFIKEEGSEKIDEILASADELSLSIICVPELLSAMNRRLRAPLKSQMTSTKRQINSKFKKRNFKSEGSFRQIQFLLCFGHLYFGYWLLFEICFL
jgi:uncharacterized protein with PIN domain